MGILKDDLAAAIARVAADVAAERAADQAKIADLEAQLAGVAVFATEVELASMLDAINAIGSSVPPAPTAAQDEPPAAAAVDRSALPFDPNA